MGIRAFLSDMLISSLISTYFAAKANGQHGKVGSTEGLGQLSICFLKMADTQLHIL